MPALSLRSCGIMAKFLNFFVVTETLGILGILIAVKT